MTKAETVKTFSVGTRVTAEMKNRIDARARELGVSQSVLVERIVWTSFAYDRWKAAKTREEREGARREYLARLRLCGGSL
jgi:hypothetical protein